MLLEKALDVIREMGATVDPADFQARKKAGRGD